MFTNRRSICNFLIAGMLAMLPLTAQDILVNIDDIYPEETSSIASGMTTGVDDISLLVNTLKNANEEYAVELIPLDAQ